MWETIMTRYKRKHKIVFLLALSLLLCGCSSGSSKKSCGGETCKIGKNEIVSYVIPTAEADVPA